MVTKSPWYLRNKVIRRNLFVISAFYCDILQIIAWVSSSTTSTIHNDSVAKKCEVLLRNLHFLLQNFQFHETREKKNFLG